MDSASLLTTTKALLKRRVLLLLPLRKYWWLTLRSPALGPRSAADNATLTIGTYNAAGTAIVAAGIDSAIALTAIDGIGETVRCDGTHLTTAGYIATDAYIGAIYGTAVFTGGVGKLYVEYRKL